MIGKAIGLGGIFLKFKNPTKMNLWYSEVLGLTTNDYGVLFSFNSDQSKSALLQLGTFSTDSDYFGSESQQVMINFRVDNLELMLIRLKAENVEILDEMETYEYGKFIHISDPEGNRIELWEPIDAAFSEEPTTEMR
jgi:predicted enzyme related to lactoylglutathione lyase